MSTNQGQSSEKEAFVCSVCGQGFESRSELDRHVRNAGFLN